MCFIDRFLQDGGIKKLQAIFKMPVSKPGESQTDRFSDRGGAVLLGRASAEEITHRSENRHWKICCRKHSGQREGFTSQRTDSVTSRGWWARAYILKGVFVTWLHDAVQVRSEAKQGWGPGRAPPGSWGVSTTERTNRPDTIGQGKLEVGRKALSQHSLTLSHISSVVLL